MTEMRELVALTGPPIYLVLTVLIFSVVLMSIKPKALGTSSRLSSIYGLLAVGSCVHILILIFFDLQWSYQNFYARRDYTVVGGPTERMAYWLANTSLIKEIWVNSSSNVRAWWWLENLCLFAAGAWTIFLATEGRRRKVPHLWAYMAISQLFAVSTALSLFYLASTYRIPPKPIPSKKKGDDINAVLPPSEADLDAPVQVSVPVILAMFTISVWPSPDSNNFMTFVTALHLLLLIPVLPSPLWTTRPHFLNLPVLSVYFAVTALSLVMRLQGTLAVASSLLPETGFVEFGNAVATALQSHPAVTLFGWDTLWTTVTFLVWNIFRDGSSKPKSKLLIPMVSATAALGVGFSAPMSLGKVMDEVFAERRAEEKTKMT